MAIEKLDNVEVGDWILLMGFTEENKKHYESGGFIVRRKDKPGEIRLKLSHDNPRADVGYWRDIMGKVFQSPGNRWYNLNHFDDYKVVKKGQCTFDEFIKNLPH